MQIHQIKQGTPDWHAYRTAHFNASDAPAMMGMSPYKSRTELLHERHVGFAAEVDAGTQARFDDGHRFEALARPIAEGIVGESLYPVTGSTGEFSASFDGITMGGEVVFEHKTLNKDIRACETADQLGVHLRIQMEHQLLVSGAERCLFLATKWNNNDELVESVFFWYEPNMSLRAEIIAGWAQFRDDLATYEPKTYAAKPAVEQIIALPALILQIEGKVVRSSLPAFKAKADAFIANIKTDLLTDEDFANAESTIKFCDDAEKSLEQAKAAAIAQTSDIDELMRTVDHISAQLREKRLLLTRTVKDKKELLKADILNKVKLAFAEHVAALEVEIAPLRLVYQARDFAGAMKNKRTLATLQNAVDTELASAKISLDAAAKALRARLTWYRANVAEHEFLFADLQSVIQKPDEDFQLLVNARIADHKAKEGEKLEAQRVLIQAEADAAAALKVTQAAAATEAFDASTTGDSAASITERPLGVLTPAAGWPFPTERRAAVAVTTSAPPSLRLGQIVERLGFTVTAEFLRTLGFEPAGRDKAAVLYHEGHFPLICQALVHHIGQVQTTGQKVAA